jgi:hypothetical protein
MSKFKWPVGLLLLALTAGLYFSPHWVVRRMADAAREHDAARFSSYVDYPALQANLRAQLRGRITGQPDSPWAALRGVVASVITDPMVDALVTPESLSALMTQGRAHGDPHQHGHGHGRRSDQARPTPEATMRMGYVGLDSFEVTVQRRGEHEGGAVDDVPAPVVFILSREGLLTWRLSGVHLPQ